MNTVSRSSSDSDGIRRVLNLKHHKNTELGNSTT